MADEWFLWSVKQYSLKEIIDHFDFPLIVKARSGYLGDTAIESMSYNEILRFHSHGKHTRVVAKDPDGRRMFSIPASSNIEFMLETEKTPRTLGRLIETVAKPFVIRPADSKFKSDQDPAKLFTLSELTVVDEYEEAYVKANGITDGSLNKYVSVIPCYVKTNLVVAEGLANRLPGQWKEYEESITKLTADVNYDACLPNQAIMLYSARKVADADNLYATLEPSAYLSLNKPTRTAAHGEYVTINTPSSIPIGDYDVIGDSSTLATEEYAAIAEPSVVARGEYITVVGDTHEDSARLKNTPKNKGNGKGFFSNLLRRKSISSTSSPSSSATATQRQQPASTSDQDSITAELTRRSRSKNLTSTKPPLTKPKPKVHKTVSRIADIPGDIRELSTREVADCLTLLSLSTYIQPFEEHLVDGAILQDLTADMMLESFCMTKMDAMKLCKFVGGWRPKTN